MVNSEGPKDGLLCEIDKPGAMDSTPHVDAEAAYMV